MSKTTNTPTVLNIFTSPLAPLTAVFETVLGHSHEIVYLSRNKLTTPHLMAEAEHYVPGVEQPQPANYTVHLSIKQKPAQEVFDTVNELIQWANTVLPATHHIEPLPAYNAHGAASLKAGTGEGLSVWCDPVVKWADAVLTVEAEPAAVLHRELTRVRSFLDAANGGE